MKELKMKELFSLLWNPAKGRLGYNLIVGNPAKVFNRLIWVGLVSILFGFLIITAFGYASVEILNNFEQTIRNNIYLMLVFSFTCFGEAVIFLFFIAAGCENLNEARLVKKKLSKSKCLNLLEYCKTYPEVDEYRKSVIAEGRIFTESEYLSIKCFILAKQQKARQAEIEQQNDAACKTIYLS